MMLSKLAMHYYRPDFTQAQAKLLIADYVRDLAPYALGDVQTAMDEYRRAPDSKFFPAVGELLRRCEAAVKERLARTKPQRPLPTESRPIMWWRLPRELWKPHWRESEIPEGNFPQREGMA